MPCLCVKSPLTSLTVAASEKINLNLWLLLIISNLTLCAGPSLGSEVFNREKTQIKTLIKSSEIFPTNLYIHRNDRGSRGGGVFTRVRKGQVGIEQLKLVTECEIEWTNDRLKKKIKICTFHPSTCLIAIWTT